MRSVRQLPTFLRRHRLTRRETNDERWLSESEATDFLVGMTRVMLDRAYRTTVRATDRNELYAPVVARS